MRRDRVELVLVSELKVLDDEDVTEFLLRFGTEGVAVPGAAEAARLPRIDPLGVFGIMMGSSSLRSAITRVAFGIARGSVGLSGDFDIFGNSWMGNALCEKDRGGKGEV